MKTSRWFATILVVVSWILSGLVGAMAAPSVTCRVELERDVLPAETVQMAIIKVTMDAPPAPREADRPPINLALVIDCSGSMQGSKIEQAREAALEALTRLDSRDRISVITYNSEVTTLVGARSAAEIDAIRNQVRSMRADGNTALFAGVSTAASEIRKNLEGNYVHRIILLSDGLANVGPSSPAELGRLGAALMKEDIAVTTVGVGTDYNEDLMAALSRNSDGNTYFVENSNDLPRIFAAEMGDVLSVVARDVILEIHCGNGIRPVRLIGRDGEIRDGRVEIRLNQLYGGQEKFALLEVEVPPMASGSERAIADATLRYENLLNGRRESSEGQTQASFSRDERDVQASVNVTVQNEVYLNAAAVNMAQAIELADEGRPREAATQLRQQARDLQQQGEATQNQPMLREAESLGKIADELEQDRRLDAAGRKGLRSRSEQIFKQQQQQ